MLFAFQSILITPWVWGPVIGEATGALQQKQHRKNFLDCDSIIHVSDIRARSRTAGKTDRLHGIHIRFSKANLQLVIVSQTFIRTGLPDPGRVYIHTINEDRLTAPRTN